MNTFTSGVNTTFSTELNQNFGLTQGNATVYTGTDLDINYSGASVTDIATSTNISVSSGVIPSTASKVLIEFIGETQFYTYETAGGSAAALTVEVNDLTSTTEIYNTISLQAATNTAASGWISPGFKIIGDLPASADSNGLSLDIDFTATISGTPASGIRKYLNDAVLITFL